MPDYLPRRDIDVVNFTANLATRLAADPAAFGLALVDVDTYLAEQERLAALYRDATGAGTRTPAGLLLKDAARARVVAMTRSLVGRLRANLDVSDESLSLLGVRRPRPKRPAIPAPAMSAELTIIDVTGATVTVRAYDPAAFARRARPRDVAGVRVMTWTGPTPPPADPRRWGHPHDSGRTTIALDFGAGLPAGTEVHAIARWFNPRRDTGPWGQRLTAHVNHSTPKPTPTTQAA